MKNYVIVAIIIILIIVGVVWFKMKSPAPVVPGEVNVTTEPAPVDMVDVSAEVSAPIVDEPASPVVDAPPAP